MIDFAHSVFAAGFYNRAFIWPSWHFYEPIIRKLAGFGRAPTGPDPDRYDARHAHCDVLVVGGGQAGIEAARSAGATALQIDVQPHTIPIDTQGFSALKQVSLATLASGTGVSNIRTGMASHVSLLRLDLPAF